MANGDNVMDKVIAGVVIAVITGYASYLFGQSTMKSQVIRDQRASAYSQFVDNRSLMLRMEELNKDYANDPEYIKARSLYNSARFRLAIFGGKDVVEALADFSYSSGDDFKKASTRLMQAMRRDLITETDAVDDMTIDRVLWPPK